jgi:hypothetical protein
LPRGFIIDKMNHNKAAAKCDEAAVESGREGLSESAAETGAEVSEAPTNTGSHLIIFPNPEKNGRIRLGPEEYMPYSSSRILLSAMPNCGKRNLILNIIHRMSPPPSACHIVHCDPLTIEYDCLADMGIQTYMYDPTDFPTLHNIVKPEDNDSAAESGGESGGDEAPPAGEGISTAAADEPRLANPVVIVDECTQDQLGRLGCHRFERLVNHVCTHKNTTLLCSIQSLLNLPPKVRRGFNHFALWKQADKDVNRLSAQRANVPPEMLDDMFELCKNRYDFIWIDLDATHDSPWRFRLNFYEPITIERT